MRSLRSMRIVRFWASIMILYFAGTFAARCEDFGRFLGEVIVKWNRDGRTMELLTDLRFKDPDGVIWTAHKGATIDGASIPQPFWSLIGGPFEGRYRDASVIHDYYCDHHLKTWEATDKVFYQGMRAMGVPKAKAETMYYAVYAFGPRWETTVSNRVVTTLSKGVRIESEMTLQTTRIESVQVTKEQVDLARAIEARLDKGEVLSLEDVERMASADRKGAKMLPVATEVKPLSTHVRNIETK